MELNIEKRAAFDNRIVEREFHAHLPFATSGKIGPSDEVRFVIQHQDLITATYDSFLYLEARVEPEDPTKTYELTSNAVAYMFDEVRFELGDQTIDAVRNPGVTTTMKGMVSLSPLESKELETACWFPKDGDKLCTGRYNAAGKLLGFSAIVPLSFLLGFAEDYRRVIANMRQTLVLRRSLTDSNCYKGETKIKIEIDKIEWRVPYLKLSDEEKLKMLGVLSKDGTVEVPFRKRELYTIPSLRSGKLELANLSTKTVFSKPRFLLVGLQTGKANDATADCSRFEPVDISNVIAYLNEKAYPYAKWNLDFSTNSYLLAYKHYCDFQRHYYQRSPQPLLSYEEFKKNPVFVVDCSKQQEDVKTGGTVDTKLELGASNGFPPNTTAYALALLDALVIYRPLSNIVVHQQA